MNTNPRWTDVLVSEPVTMINAFSVPPDESERFLQRWKDNAQAMATQPGMIRARMYRAMADEVEIRFVNVAEWESGEALARARSNPEWRASAERLLQDPELHVVARPAIYQVALEFGPDGAP